jgi:hypothetical protein
MPVPDNIDALATPAPLRDSPGRHFRDVLPRMPCGDGIGGEWFWRRFDYFGFSIGTRAEAGIKRSATVLFCFISGSA